MPDAAPRRQHQQKAARQMQAVSSVGTCCFGFMTEGEPTEEKTEFERENRRQDPGGRERRELWLDEARNRTNDRDMKKQDEDR